MKKLLLILLLTTCTFSFAQLNEKSSTIKTIEKVSASPNPFSTRTNISFFSKNEQEIILVIKNLVGKTVYKYTFLSEEGNNKIPFYKEDLIPGIYLYTIQTDKEAITKRLIIK